MNKSLSLKPFQESPSNKEILFSWSKNNKTITLRYELLGFVDVLWPEINKNQRKFDLWKHTCFELFLKKENEDRYLEFNFSPSHEWDSYEFQSYRKPQPVVRFESPVVIIKTYDYILEVELELPPSWLDAELKASATAVIETKSHETSFFAFKHSSEPDFHDQSTFIINFD